MGSALSPRGCDAGQTAVLDSVTHARPQHRRTTRRRHRRGLTGLPVPAWDRGTVITDLLLERPWLLPSLLVVLVVLGPIVGAWLVPRQRLAWWLTGLSLLPVLALTLVPVERVLYARCTVAWTLPTAGRVELMANLVLFVASVLLAGVATRRPVRVAAVASVLSVGIETLQALVPSLGRSCDTNDWLNNTLGAVVGAALAWTAIVLARGAVTDGPGRSYRLDRHCPHVRKHNHDATSD